VNSGAPPEEITLYGLFSNYVLFLNSPGNQRLLATDDEGRQLPASDLVYTRYMGNQYTNNIFNRVNQSVTDIMQTGGAFSLEPVQNKNGVSRIYVSWPIAGQSSSLMSMSGKVAGLPR